MNDDTFEDNFAWFEWTFVAPEDGATTEERTPESPFANGPVVGQWGDDWAWTM
jgi:hypothetical protein